jgi:thiol-disulfide isomerase/thioredoxin
MLLAPVVAVALAVGGPRFIEDDYPKALAQARKEGKLLFIEAWAPWCHSCVAMREQVLTRPELRVAETEVVFAAIDTEKVRNAAFLERFPVQVWPTLFLIEPRGEKVALQWAGGADVAQLQALIAAARNPHEGDALLSRGDLAGAAASYSRALKGTESGEARLMLSLLTALAFSQQHEACARTAEQGFATLSQASDRAAVVTWGLDCALKLDPAEEDWAALRTSLATRAREAMTLEGAMPDDVSGLYALLVEDLKSRGDHEGAHALARAWLGFLEGAAARAGTAAGRAVYDAHRVGAALEAGVPALALEALLASEKALPLDYNPPARLARLYKALGRGDDAAAAIDRALRKCTEGPRKLGLFRAKFELLRDRADDAGMRAVLTQAQTHASKLPKGKAYDLSRRWLDEAQGGAANPSAPPR